MDSDNKPTSVKTDTDKYLVYNYDKLSRLHDKTIKSGTNSYLSNVTYVNDRSNQIKTTLVESITNKNSVEGKKDKISYIYDAEDNLIGFKYNNDQYYYARNGQGDIIGILDNNLNNVISYIYDTWGKLLSIRNASGQDVTSDTTSIGYINQYSRYRGYRYDNETSII